MRSLIAATIHRHDLWDSTLSGFGVRLSPGRHCSFVVRYRVNGRLRRFTIGPFPRVSLADARQKARDALRDAQGGKDLAAEKIEARRAATFAELAHEYIERHASKKRSGREDIRLLKGSPHKKKTGKKPHVPIVTRWGSRKVKEITRATCAISLTTWPRARRSWPIGSWRWCGRCSTSASSATGSR
ncbi:MAG: DUF4102 domain-containing protein [Acidobacteria bacterium]|nr:DUF4102 domain-containing protein [Acidobacteriota bacterium]